MRVDVVVDARRIEAADEIGALADRVIEQILDAGICDDSALRKSDDLDVEEIARRFAHAEQSMQAGQADFRVDVDMGPQRRRAIGDDLLNEAPRALFDGIAHSRRSSFSRAMRSLTVSPARWGWNGRPMSVLSRWICPSTMPATSSAPLRSIRCASASAGAPASVKAAMRPSLRRTSDAAAVGEKRIGEKARCHGHWRHGINWTRRAATT